MCVYAQLLSNIQLFVTPWTVAHRAPLSMGFPRQEYWSGLPFPTREDLPDPGIKPMSPVSLLHWQVGFFNHRDTWEALTVLRSNQQSLGLK